MVGLTWVIVNFIPGGGIDFVGWGISNFWGIILFYSFCAILDYLIFSYFWVKVIGFLFLFFGGGCWGEGSPLFRD